MPRPKRSTDRSRDRPSSVALLILLALGWWVFYGQGQGETQRGPANPDPADYLLDVTFGDVKLDTKDIPADRGGQTSRPPEPVQQSQGCRYSLGGSKHVFPIKAGHHYSYVDTWGAPRGQGSGTPDRRHKGTDIFAERGTPVVAITDGVIGNNFGWGGGLSGNRLWVLGRDGINYYYAHLTAFAKGVGPRVAVKAGEVVAYVGNTGAQGTMPHLHLSMSTRGYEDPYLFNPYSCIIAWDTKR